MFQCVPSAALWCIVVGSLAAGAGAQPIKELAREARASVVSLKIFGNSGQEIAGGTGFVVGDGLVVTNHHVAESARRIEAVLSSEETVEARAVVAQDEENDLALLSFPDLDAPALRLASNAAVEPGDPVVVVGNPFGLTGSVSDGIVSAVRPSGLGEDSDHFQRMALIQVTAPISPGSSGSPVIGVDGAVVGVAVGGYVHGQNLNFAIPAATVARLMASADLENEVRTLGSRPGAGTLYVLRNLGISAVLLGAIAYALWRLRD